jgi:DNA-binding transcriptional LysR family regulator
MFECLGRLGAESPHTRVELIESVLGGTAEAVTRGEADIAITSIVPPGFMGESLLRMRLMPVAQPDHPLHKLDRALTTGDLRAHRQLVVRESGSTRSTPVSVEATQRWTVSNMTTSIDAARRGYGYAWAPEEKIVDELASGTLKPLQLREGREREAELFLVIATRDAAGPGVLRLADLIREMTQRACTAEQAKPTKRAKKT